MAIPDASEQALKAAKALVKDIEFFRSHGTGEMNAHYADHETGDGYSWIVRRAKALAEQIDSFDSRAHLRRIEALAEEACNEVDAHVGEIAPVALGSIASS